MLCIIKMWLKSQEFFNLKHFFRRSIMADPTGAYEKGKLYQLDLAHLLADPDQPRKPRPSSAS